MNYEQIVAFVRVASDGTFARASKSLHKSQPAVSKLVRNLEDDLGVELFDRSAYRPVLTDAGTLLLERAKDWIEETQSLHRFGRSLSDDIESMIRIVLEAITPLPPVLEVMASVQARFPRVRYELATERMSGALEALEEERATIVVTGDHGKRRIRTRLFESRSLAKVAVSPFAAPNHPLALHDGPLSARTLRTYPQVVLSESGRGDMPSTVNVLEGGLQWTVSDVHAKREILVAAMGWGGLPDHIAKADVEAGRLTRLSVPSFDVEQVELFAVRRRDRPWGIVASELWTRLGIAFAELDG